jgi:hypothetical protein
MPDTEHLKMSTAAIVCAAAGCTTRPKQGEFCAAHRAAGALQTMQTENENLRMQIEELKLAREIAELERPQFSMDDLEQHINELVDARITARLGSLPALAEPPQQQETIFAHAEGQSLQQQPPAVPSRQRVASQQPQQRRALPPPPGARRDQTRPRLVRQEAVRGQTDAEA